MAIFLIILAVLLLLLIGFLIAPVRVHVDTDESLYEISQSPVIRFFLFIHNGLPSLRLQIGGINIPLRLPKKKIEAKQVKPKKDKKKKGFHKSASTWKFLIRKACTSFYVRKFIIDVDTENVALNAKLVPVFLLISRGPVQLSSNFNGRAYLHLEMENRFGRLLWIFIQFLTKK